MTARFGGIRAVAGDSFRLMVAMPTNDQIRRANLAREPVLDGSVKGQAGGFAFLISKKTPLSAGAALGMVGSPPQLSEAADAVSSD
jgi:hypothetical protein